MRPIFFSLLIGLASTITGCGEPDESDAIWNTVLNDFGHRPEISEFGKGDLILLSPRTQVWTQEQLRGMGTDPRTTCRIRESLYEALTSIQHTRPVTHLMKGDDGWRVATVEQEKKYSAISNDRIDGKSVKSVVFVSAPGMSNDGTEAVVIVSFSWGMHGGLGRYYLEKDMQVWRINCSHLDFYV